jgi:murein DD-endopeptidase MepM/ murein hydrolase activator NlpD
MLLAALLLLGAPPARAAGLTLAPPVGGAVVRGFDDVSRFAAGHRGVDLAGAVGETVRAAAVGRVFFAGVVAGTPTVSIDHGNGWRTTYQPVVARVAEGDEVGAGQDIGTLRAGHCPASACLHWGLTDGVDYADPTAYLELRPVRLLPAGSEPRAAPEIGHAVVADTGGGLPVSGRISSPFGMRVHPITGVYKLHDGADIAAPCGTAITRGHGEQDDLELGLRLARVRRARRRAGDLVQPPARGGRGRRHGVGRRRPGREGRQHRAVHRVPPALDGVAGRRAVRPAHARG